ncbi:MAG: rplO [Ilumatobacteraceae bacterium]|nr:rplO [Ilumatobacteraceae bacterium]
MRVDELAPSPGSNKAKMRVGRGIGGKGGKTAGRGTKGQQSRGRGKVARGFEGGQMPLKQRVPKLKGFNNPFRVEYTAVNLHQLAKLEVTEATPEVFIKHGMLRKGDYVKILGYGELTAKVDVTAHAVSKTAEAAITAAGGSVTLVPMPFKVRPAANGNQFTNR